MTDASPAISFLDEVLDAATINDSTLHLADGYEMSISDLSKISSNWASAISSSTAKISGVIAVVGSGKTRDAISSIFAVLRSGSAYLYIDHKLTLERLEALRELVILDLVIDASGTPQGAKVTTSLLNLNAGAGRASASKGRLSLSDREGNGSSHPPRAVTDIAYLIFTSGST